MAWKLLNAHLESQIYNFLKSSPKFHSADLKSENHLDFTFNYISLLVQRLETYLSILY